MKNTKLKRLVITEGAEQQDGEGTQVTTLWMLF